MIMKYHYNRKFKHSFDLVFIQFTKVLR